MATRKKKRFKPIRKLARNFFLKDVEKWIPKNSKDLRLANEIKQITQPAFERILTRVTHYYVVQEFYSAIDNALTSRTAFYMGKLKSDILKISNQSISSHRSKKLDRLIKDHFFKIEMAISTLWTDPNFLPDHKQYRNAFNVVVQLSNANSAESTHLRKRITYEFYFGVERVKWLCKMRGRHQYDQFISNHILSNLKLSNFLRRGKIRHTHMTMKSFEDSRTRFMKNFKN